MPAGAVPARPARMELGELISAESALLLLVSMFALAWFGTVRPPGRTTGAGLQSSEDAWSGLTNVRWAMILAVLLALGVVAVHIGQAAHGTKTETGSLVAAAGGLCGVLLVWRVLVELPDPGRVVDVKLGAYVGLLCAWGIAIGGWRTRAAERGQRRHAPRTPRTVRSAPG